MSKSIHNEGVPRPGDKIHIPLSEGEAVRLLGKVKPTKDMPRPGATGKSKPTPKSKRVSHKSLNQSVEHGTR